MKREVATERLYLKDGEVTTGGGDFLLCGKGQEIPDGYEAPKPKVTPKKAAAKQTKTAANKQAKTPENKGE